MPRKPKCNICEILKYQNFALNAKHGYQVTRYLKLAQRARNNIIKRSKFYNNGADLKGHYCEGDHTIMAVDIVMKHDALLLKLRDYGKESRKRVMRELQKSAFKYAEDVILHGFNSIEALESRMELDRRKHNLDVRRRRGNVTRIS